MTIYPRGIVAVLTLLAIDWLGLDGRFALLVVGLDALVAFGPLFAHPRSGTDSTHAT